MDGPLIFVLELWVPFGVNFFLPKMTRDQPVPNRAMAMVLVCTRSRPSGKTNVTDRDPSLAASLMKEDDVFAIAYCDWS